MTGAHVHDAGQVAGEDRGAVPGRRPAGQVARSAVTAGDRRCEGLLSLGEAAGAGPEVMGEIDALIRTVTEATRDVMAALARSASVDAAPSRPRSPRSAAAAGAEDPGEATVPGLGADAGVDGAATGDRAGTDDDAGPGGGPGDAGPVLVERHHISVEDLPELTDHALLRQPEGIGTAADRCPVLPLTAMIDMAVRAAGRLVPDQVVVGLANVRGLRRPVAAPPTDVVLEARVEAPGLVEVTIPDHFRAQVRLAGSHPPVPPRDERPLVGEGPPPHTGLEVYGQRWLLHGPAYQAIAAIRSMADDGLRAEVVSKPAAGALLDAVSQLLAYWIGYRATENRLALPFRVDRIDVHGPSPAAGERLACVVRIVDVEPSVVRADVELGREDGTVWARINHFTGRRVAGDGRVLRIMHDPEHVVLAQARAGYWLLRDAFDSAATRELLALRYLDERERAEHARLGAVARRAWLARRIAVKDAVRQWLWQRGASPMFPIEVPVHDDPGGAPVVTCPGERRVRVAVAQRDALVAVAVAGDDDHHDPGIALEPVEHRGAALAQLTLTHAERALGVGHDRDEWVTRLWTVKEAVARAAGLAVEGLPREVEIDEVDGDLARVGDRRVRSVRDGSWMVSHTVGR